MSGSTKLVLWGAGAILALIVLLAINPFVSIDATSRGLLKNWGAMSNEILQPGIHLRIPIKQTIEEISIQPIQLDHKVAVGNDGAITKDNQTIGAELTVFYKYIPERLVEMYSKFGEDKIKAIITANLRESFKSTIGNYDIFKLPTVQDEIRAKVFEELKSKLVDYPIEITEMKVVNYDWSDDFDAQIKQTMNKSQEVKQKEQELLIAEQEAQKQVKQASAEKTATITRAEGQKEKARLESEAKTFEGQGIRNYNDSIAQKWDIEKNKLELEIAKIKAERWNGVYVSTNNYGPIPIQTGDLLGK